MRIQFDSEHLDESLAEATTVSEVASWPLFQRRVLSDQAVEILLAAGRVEAAVAALTREGPTYGKEFQLRIEGRLAVARGHLRAAIRALTAAAEIWQQAGYREEESRARRALAHALFLSGNVGGAEAQLRTLLQDAQGRGAAFEVRKCRHQLDRLGNRG